MNLELMEKRSLPRQRKTWQLHDENKDVREASAGFILKKFTTHGASDYVFPLICFHSNSTFFCVLSIKC